MTTELRDRLQSHLGTAYSLERELGGGGMSRVFVCEETSLKRKVVVKVLPPELAAGVSTERFRREIQFAAQLQHPLIVPVLHASEGDDLLFYTMPFVAGEALRARLKREGALPVTDALRILRDVATALAFAHDRGIVHRDIKPDNILLTGSTRDGEYAVVTDFGVARAIDSSADGPTLTSTGVALGTPTYMAPEQIVGDSRMDHRVDIYAAGVLAYEMLTGQPPFGGVSPQALLAAHLTRAPEPVSSVRPTIPADLDALVTRCLAKEPGDRVASAAELRRGVEALLLRETASGLPMPNGAQAPRGAAGGLSPVGAPRRSRWSRAGAVALVALVLVGAAVAVMSRGRGREPKTGVAAAAADSTIRSIAVLPFVNASSDSANEYFSDGVTDELIAALTGVAGLRVASRSSSFAFKGSRLRPRAVGDSLGVQAVLEGDVRRSGDRLRIMAQLTRVRDSFPIWSRRYDRELRDVFEVQEELARSILVALQPSLAGRVASGLTAGDVGQPQRLLNYGTTNREAWESYQRGRYFWNRRTGPAFQEAVRNFQEAIRRDSTYARAWAGLADSYCIMANFGVRAGRDVCPQAERAALRAIALDSSLAEAHASLGFVRLFYDWDPDSAGKEFAKALALDSTFANAHLFLQHVAWARNADTAAAIRHIRAALALEPLSLILNSRAGTTYLRAGRLDDAERAFRHALELDSTFYDAQAYLATLRVMRGDYAAGIATLERLQDSLRLGRAYALAGRRTDAERVVAALERKARQAYVSPIRMAGVYSALGDNDAAFRWLNRGYDSREPDMVFLAYDSDLSLRTDSRFAELVQRVRTLHDRR